MSKYFYAVATLPYITYESDSFMSPEEFLEFCSYQLRQDRFLAIARLSLQPPSASSVRSCGSDAVDRFFRFERGMRNALVRHRAAKSGRDASAFISPDLQGNDLSDDVAASELARTAFAAGASSPLQAEEILDRGRWEILDQVEVTHHFDFDNLALYYLRLLILTRKAGRTRELGAAGYDAEYAKMTQSMGNPGSSGA
ncbi:MAG TPA: DUF2764 family protein [Spirochaetia bacterium]|nr:DUF2764 family protein [Spirochaetia bacterium]